MKKDRINLLKTTAIQESLKMAPEFWLSKVLANDAEEDATTTTATTTITTTIKTQQKTTTATTTTTIKTHKKTRTTNFRKFKVQRYLN